MRKGAVFGWITSFGRYKKKESGRRGMPVAGSDPNGRGGGCLFHVSQKKKTQSNVGTTGGGGKEQVELTTGKKKTGLVMF